MKRNAKWLVSFMDGRRPSQSIRESGRVAEEYKRYLYGDRSTRVFSSLVTGLFSGRMLVRQGGHIANVARSNLLDFRYDCLKENSR